MSSNVGGGNRGGGRAPRQNRGWRKKSKKRPAAEVMGPVVRQLQQNMQEHPNNITAATISSVRPGGWNAVVRQLGPHVMAPISTLPALDSSQYVGLNQTQRDGGAPSSLTPYTGLAPVVDSQVPGYLETPAAERGMHLLCAGCKQQGHSLGICAGPPREGGMMTGCPWCNSSQHFFDMCPHTQSQGEEEVFRILVVRRAKLAPFRTKVNWLALVKEQSEDYKQWLHTQQLVPLLVEVVEMAATTDYFSQWKYDIMRSTSTHEANIMRRQTSLLADGVDRDESFNEERKVDVTNSRLAKKAPATIDHKMDDADNDASKNDNPMLAQIMEMLRSGQEALRSSQATNDARLKALEASQQSSQAATEALLAQSQAREEELRRRIQQLEQEKRNKEANIKRTEDIKRECESD
ncbi:hypothetical protein F5Y18DRAFT_431189 [Xylariaceae sp. FL1019]|nr:hypothetical protein F5Y18DRAFT_431189 [Xylariaceae sp. FL1019]